MRVRMVGLHKAGLNYETFPVGLREGPQQAAEAGAQGLDGEATLEEMLLDSFGQASQLQQPGAGLAATMTAEKTRRREASAQAAPPEPTQLEAREGEAQPSCIMGTETQPDLPTDAARVLDDSPAAAAAAPPPRSLRSQQRAFNSAETPSGSAAPRATTAAGAPSGGEELVQETPSEKVGRGGAPAGGAALEEGAAEAPFPHLPPTEVQPSPEHCPPTAPPSLVLCVAETPAPAATPTPAAAAAAEPDSLAGLAQFDVQIEAPAAASPWQAQADAACAHGGGPCGSEFDYFTATQLTPEHDSAHAWAAGLAAPPSRSMPPPLPRPQAQAVHQAAPAPAPQLQQVPPQHHQAPRPPPDDAADGDRPHPLRQREAGGFRPHRIAVAAGAAPGEAAAYSLPGGGARPAGGRRGGGDPAAAAAARARVAALQAELASIFQGEEEVPAAPRAAPGGFASASRLAAGAGAAPQHQQPMQQQRPAPPTAPIDAQPRDLGGVGRFGAPQEPAAKRRRPSPEAQQPSPPPPEQQERRSSPSAPPPLPPPPGMVAMAGFTTGRGGSILVSEAKLAETRWLLAESPAPAEGQPRAAAEAAEAAAGPADSPAPGATVAMAGFTTGRGAAVSVSAAKLAEAARLLASVGDEEAPPEEAEEAAADDTPTLRRQVLRSRLGPASPAEPSAAKGAGGRGGAALSRFAPAPAAPAQSAVAAEGGAGSSGRAARGGRGKFVTPRSVAPPGRAPPAAAPAAAAAARPGGGAPPAAQHQFHDLRTSKLRAALAGLPAAAAAPPARHPPLPLDSTTAAEYVFLGPGPGARVGWERMRLRLLEAGARADLASDEWVSNHYRWVVWKLARAELARGPAARGRLLTPAVAEDELRRRYEWEHVRGHRPLLKALLQQDEAPGAAAVLLVASSHPGGGPAGGGGGPAASLELTDGWYWVRAQCDGPLSELVRRGAAAPGAKLRVCCAELAAAGPGEPLAAARAATLRLTANNARPAPPGARLGRQPHRSTLVPLSGVRPSGGVVPQTLVVVLRAYPTLVWCKLPSGVAVWQTERAHAAALARTRGAVAAAEAAAAGEAHEAEVALCRGWLRNGKPGGLAQEERWYAEAVTAQDAGGGGGGGDALAALSPAARAALQRFADARQALMEAARQEGLARHRRDVPALPESTAEVATLLVGEVKHSARGAPPSAMALVTIWRPAGDIREGGVYRVGALEALKPSDSGGGRLHDGLLPLRTSRHSRWEHLPGPPPALASVAFPRAAPPLGGLPALAAGGGPRGRAAVFDFAGVLLGAGQVYRAADYSHFQWVFLGDHTCGAPGEGEGEGEGEAAWDPAAPWLLAVRLQGGQEAVDWVDPQADAGRAFCLRDLELRGADDARRLWQAEGGQCSAVARGGRRGTAAEAAAWAAANPGAVERLRSRVAALLG